MKLSFLLIMCLLLTSCLATRVENKTLLPAVQSAWPGVRDDIQMDPVEAVSAATIQSASLAIAEGDKTGIRAIFWAPMDAAASDGIAFRLSSGQISPGVAVSLIERLVKFRAAILELQEID